MPPYVETDLKKAMNHVMTAILTQMMDVPHYVCLSRMLIATLRFQINAIYAETECEILLNYVMTD